MEGLFRVVGKELLGAKLQKRALRNRVKQCERALLHDGLQNGDYSHIRRELIRRRNEARQREREEREDERIERGIEERRIERGEDESEGEDEGREAQRMVRDAFLDDGGDSNFSGSELEEMRMVKWKDEEESFRVDQRRRGGGERGRRGRRERGRRSKERERKRRNKRLNMRRVEWVTKCITSMQDTGERLDRRKVELLINIMKTMH